MGFAEIAALVVAIAGIAASAYSADKANQAQKDLARFQDEANQKYLQQAQEYNSPKQQMLRFQQAGLNPHLVYGQGSPGNIDPLKYPDVKYTDYGDVARGIQGLSPLVNQTRLTSAQVNAQNASTQQKYADTELKKVQKQLVQRNPYMDDSALNAVIETLKSTAEQKRLQNDGQRISNDIQEKSAQSQVTKVFKEVELLEARFKLAESDDKIKAEVLKSAEFENAILEVQKKFLADGDIGPQQVYQFIQLLLLNLMKRK